MSQSICIEATEANSSDRIPGTSWRQVRRKAITWVYPDDMNEFKEILDQSAYAYPRLEGEDETVYVVEAPTFESGSSYQLLRNSLAGTPYAGLLPDLPDGYEDADVTLTILW